MDIDGRHEDFGGERHVRFLGILVVLGVIVLNLAVGVASELFLKSRLADAESLAAVTTQSIATALNGSLSNAAQVTKLAAHLLVKECERELKSDGKIEPATLNAYFDAMRASLPAGALLHVTNASGRVIFGPGAGSARPASYADRDFFRPLMDGRVRSRIWVTNMLDGRATHLELIAFVARYEGANGHPAGVISIAIPLPYFQSLLEISGLGPHGIALIRDASTALIAIYPPSKVDKLGNRHFSPQLAQTIASGISAHTFHATRTGDGIERIDSYRRLSGLPFYLVVGKSAGDYLAIWYSTRRWVLLSDLVCLLVSIVFAATLWRIAEKVHALQRDEALRARRDTLTGLPNRLALMEHLPSAIARATRSGAVLVVGMLDLDDFKSINDRFGHSVGDLLLVELSRRIHSLARSGDFVARLGGDEFILVFEGFSAATAEQQLQQALARVHRAVEDVFEVGEARQVRVGMSMGIALFPRDGAYADALLRQADAAMYAVKQNKGKRPTWWNMSALPRSAAPPAACPA